MKKIILFLAIVLSNFCFSQHITTTATPVGYWNMNGNITGALNWLGTSTAQDLIIKTNNTERFRIGSAGSFTTNYNGYSNNFLSKTSQITSANSTTSLTNTSTRVQELIGALTHSFNLPNATTLLTGFIIEFNNNSAGNLFIRNFSGSAQKTVIPGGYCTAICTSTSSSAGIWDFHFMLPANSQYGTAGALITGSLGVTGVGLISGGLTTPTVYGSSAAGGTLNLNCTSSATAGIINMGANPSCTTNIGSATGSLNILSSVKANQSFSVAGTSTLTGLQNNGNIAYTGSLTTGSLPYTDTGILAALQSSVNGYNQVILQNTSNANNASTNLILSNDQGTATNNYGEFGMNSSTFSGTGIFSKPSYLYLNSINSGLAIGTSSNSSVHLLSNGLERFKIDSIGNVYTIGNVTNVNNNNVFFGKDVNNVSFSGIESAAFGNNTAKNLATGNGNTIFGSVTARTFTQCNQCTVFGSDAISSSSLATNVNVFGVQAASSYTASGPIFAFGTQALKDLKNGTNNHAFGNLSAKDFTTGSNNLFLCPNTSSLVSGNANTIIGSNITFPASSSFSNNIILADGSGNIKYRWDGTSNSFTGAVSATTLQGSSSTTGTINILPSTGTVGLVQIGNSGTQTVNIGNAVANPTNLGIVRIGQGTSVIDIGQSQAAFPSIWLQQSTPSTINYALSGDANSTYLNAPSSIIFSTGNSQRAFLSASIFSTTVPFNSTSTATISGAMVAASTLSVGTNFQASGTMSVTGASTLTGAIRAANNLSVTGTMSVGSTATVSGAMVAASTLSVGTNLQASGTMSITGASTLTGAVRASNNLSVTGTFSTGSTATITGQANLSNTVNVLGGMTLNSASSATTTMPATSGTVANLSDVLTPYVFNTATSSNLSDNGTTYLGSIPAFQFSGSNLNAPYLLPYNCTLVGYCYNTVITGTVGSNETSTISINGSTTQYTLSSGITYSNVSAYQTYTATGLNQNFNAGETINIKHVAPNWATNPTNLMVSLTLYFVRRQ